MKLYYLNDEPNPISVRVMDSRYDPATATGDIFTVLQKAEGKEFEVLMPDNHVLWIKKWKGMVMLSSFEVSVLADLVQASSEQQPRSQQSEGS